MAHDPTCLPTSEDNTPFQDTAIYPAIQKYQTSWFQVIQQDCYLTSALCSLEYPNSSERNVKGWRDSEHGVTQYDIMKPKCQLAGYAFCQTDLAPTSPLVNLFERNCLLLAIGSSTPDYNGLNSTTYSDYKLSGSKEWCLRACSSG